MTGHLGYRLITSIGLVISVSIMPRTAIAQRTLDRDAQEAAYVRERPILFLEIPVEGPESLPLATRERVASNEVALAFYSELLSGTTTTTESWDPGMALFWLAESGDPKYLQQFMAHSSPDAPLLARDFGNRTIMAVYGLLRHMETPAAYRKLRELLLESPTGHREEVRRAISTIVGTRVLSALELEANSPADVRIHLERARAAAPSRGERWPCPAPHVWARASTSEWHGCRRQ